MSRNGLSSRHSSTRRFQVESLEDRRLLAAQPAVALSAPAQVMIGEDFQITATFDNADATDPGFGPFVDLYIPVNGSDGVAGSGVDGIAFSGANYLGASIATTLLTFPDDGGGFGSVVHPYAVDATGTPLTVLGAAGDQLAVLQLPFGSFTAEQPPADIVIDMHLSNLADLGQPLNLRARAGFEFGNDALANPSVDPSLVSAGTSASGWTVAAPVEPTLIQLRKIYSGPEDETATGPNFPRQYTIEIDVADGQTVTNLDVVDLLPNNLEAISIDSILPS
ncbi:MAG: hypothetical protein KDA61_06635, partial [Planctomycetales bacterium]|nr:hypothetical protein [Planctomycetales bacterium]